ncbi:hypothetical protein PtrSN002B_001195 [Pyrenophora tritici-repentis]|uniref:Uncharacterized protein n=2 Tax=Pyrenophora tritici-repentis TaxID=45151 RepID=A0A2W1F5E6_9PLEO|nr:uncharacterized protein PTRG_03661 [Pyrenophora tritici-repentis Pt-1C-BFP]KAA8620285.1 hypothetical protein PtrV1_07379 [Pyrenophora tritici-repentis]EDU46499.1 predicted protein [Pyrenophora tritici-repentis Pt-1C-BFP]KAF7448438.1 hypothetical protein A1F99_078020 [Pyrenophora tritici-repentis]KAF7572160.1 hypothetical protein PtrM4_096600 [Pyrenophora tritici-repentis]KAG9384660.1 hypothetical protein A1F94_004207 [Pyrenophora tritici-repentis]
MGILQRLERVSVLSWGGSESSANISGEQSQGFAHGSGSEERKRDDLEDLQHPRPAPAI